MEKNKKTKKYKVKTWKSCWSVDRQPASYSLPFPKLFANINSMYSNLLFHVGRHNSALVKKKVPKNTKKKHRRKGKVKSFHFFFKSNIDCLLPLGSYWLSPIFKLYEKKGHSVRHHNQWHLILFIPSHPRVFARFVMPIWFNPFICCVSASPAGTIIIDIGRLNWNKCSCFCTFLTTKCRLFFIYLLILKTFSCLIPSTQK